MYAWCIHVFTSPHAYKKNKEISQKRKKETEIHFVFQCPVYNNDKKKIVHLSCAHQHPERSHDTD